MRRAYVYRLHPTVAQTASLLWRLNRCRELYNACLEERREAFRHGVSVGRYDQSRQLVEVKAVRPEYREIDAQVLQDVVWRVDRAYQEFFRRCKTGKTPGYPRFKGRDRYDSFTHRQTGWKIVDGRLVLAGVGPLKVRWSRDIAGTVKTVTIRRDADQWYVSFSCDLGDPAVAPKTGPSIGVDVGLEAFATLSTGERIENPRHFRRGEATLAKRQQRLARRQRGSKRRAKARLLVAKAHRKTRNQRRDFHHKTARALVDRYALIAVEDLNIRGMVANHSLAKSINDAGWGTFLACLEHKAEGAGVRVVRVNPAGTSQTCVCGARVEKALSERWHECASCGLSLPRDQVSAMLILGRADPSGVAA
jgi:putative transposase